MIGAVIQGKGPFTLMSRCLDLQDDDTDGEEEDVHRDPFGVHQGPGGRFQEHSVSSKAIVLQELGSLFDSLLRHQDFFVNTWGLARQIQRCAPKHAPYWSGQFLKIFNMESKF